MTDDSPDRSEWRGRLYAASVAVIAAPFVPNVGGESIPVQLFGVSALGVAAVGLYGTYDPDRLGFADESGPIVALAALGAVASLLFAL